LLLVVPSLSTSHHRRTPNLQFSLRFEKSGEKTLTLRKRRMFFRVFAASRQKLDKASRAQPMSRRQGSRGDQQEFGRWD